jgi:DNA (cytosine-5)-methyltransferase 1
MIRPSSFEICAGAGGQALGLEQAGFEHVGLLEIDPHACQTLRTNRSHWNVIESDLRLYNASSWKGVELLSGGVPCPPFSVAGKRLGNLDERDLFPDAIRLVEECRPRGVMFENVRGLLDPIFEVYREKITEDLRKLGYVVDWKLFNAKDFGVPQSRPRAVLVALKKSEAEHFVWPSPAAEPPRTVGETLYDLMASRGWRGANEWREKANSIAPTLVGGSKKHGGPDLGPTRAKKAWLALGVDGMGIADQAPDEHFIGMPRLTVGMAARIQGFPDDWTFSGKKTVAYRQVGNAFPPPVAKAIGQAIFKAIEASAKSKLVRM